MSSHLNPLARSLYGANRFSWVDTSWVVPRNLLVEVQSVSDPFIKGPNYFNPHPMRANSTQCNFFFFFPLISVEHLHVISLFYTPHHTTRTEESSHTPSNLPCLTKSMFDPEPSSDSSTPSTTSTHHIFIQDCSFRTSCLRSLIA